MKEPRLSHYQKNQLVQWIDLDTEAAFDKNTSTAIGKAIMDALGWTKESFSYQFDDLGFRNPTGVLADDHFLALGCSFTMGVGLSNTQTWPHRLAEMLKMPVYNAGQGGAAPDTVYRIARYMIPEYRPAGVFVMVPQKQRFEIVSDFFSEGRPNTLSPSDYENEEFKGIAKAVSGEWFQDMHEEKNRLALEQICNMNGLPYIELTLDEAPGIERKFRVIEFITRNMDDFKGKLARDLEHPGTYWQDAVAKMMFEKYKSHSLVRHLGE